MVEAALQEYEIVEVEDAEAGSLESEMVEAGSW